MTVGFAPATTPVIGAPAAATTSAGQPASEGGLFATLLALLAPSAAGSNLADTLLPDGLPATLAGLAQAKEQLPEDLEAQLKAKAGQLGIDLEGLDDLLAGIELSTEMPVDNAALAEAVAGLVKALAGPTDAPASSEATDAPVPPDLEAAADALFALLGATPPPTPTVPATEDTFTELVGALTEGLTGRGKPTDGAAAPTPPPLGGDNPAPDASVPTVSSSGSDETGDTPVAAGTRAPLVERLARLLDDTAQAMATANPQLAEKLAALAKTLPALPDNVLNALEAAIGDSADETTPALASLIDSLARPRQAARTATTPAFAVPKLDLPTLDAEPASRSAVEPLAPPKPAADDEDGSAPPATALARPNARPDAAPSGPPEHAAPTIPAPADANKTADTPPAGAAAAQPLPTAAPAALRVVQAAYQQPTTPINLPQVAFEIVRQFDAGVSRFQIRLDPAELGRIDVQLDVDRAGNINARMVVDRPETLDLMQRDQRALQQALQQAGLDSNRTSLEFSLRQNPFGGDGSADGRNQGQPGRQMGGQGAGEAATDPVPEIYRGTAASGALNLFV
jgi:flagellar hook-length control protein FliK